MNRPSMQAVLSAAGTVGSYLASIKEIVTVTLLVLFALAAVWKKTTAVAEMPAAMAQQHHDLMTREDADTSLLRSMLRVERAQLCVSTTPRADWADRCFFKDLMRP